MRSHSLASYKPQPAALATAGFSMIELLVSISIIVLVLTVTLTRHSAFDSAVLLRGEAFDVALAIREIQLGAISATNDGSGEFRSTLGVHLTENSNEYSLFRDSNGDNRYQTSELYGSQGIIDPRFEIGSLDVGGSNVSEATILFRRPNYDALFYDGSGNVISATTAQIELRLQGTSGGNCGSQWRLVEITNAGQIAVVNCP